MKRVVVILIPVFWVLFSCDNDEQLDQSEVIASLDFDDGVANVEVTNSHCIVSSEGTLYFVDVSIPQTPAVVSSLDLEVGWISDILTGQNYLYASVGYDGLRIVDISDPLEPELIGSYIPSPPPDYNLGDLVKIDDLIYALEWNGGLRIFDVSTPTDPIWVNDFCSIYYYQAAAASGSYLYLLRSSQGIEIVNIEDPLLPAVIGFLENTDEWSGGLAVQNDYIYISSHHQGLHVVDAADPENPVVCGSCPASGGGTDVYVQGSKAYVCTIMCDGAISDSPSDACGVVVFDISDPVNPAYLEHTKEITDACDVCKSGEYLYIAGDEKLYIVYDGQ